MDYTIQSVPGSQLNLGETPGGLYCALKALGIPLVGFKSDGILTNPVTNFQIQGDGVQIIGRLEIVAGQQTLSGSITAEDIYTSPILDGIREFCFRRQ